MICFVLKGPLGAVVIIGLKSTFSNIHSRLRPEFPLSALFNTARIQHCGREAGGRGVEGEVILGNVGK